VSTLLFVSDAKVVHEPDPPLNSPVKSSKSKNSQTRKGIVMKRPVSTFGLLVVLTIFLTACATSYQPVPPITPVDVDAGGYALKTQNMLVVLDASSSMDDGYQQWKKFDIATSVVGNMAQTIPSDMGIKSGLRIFGGDPNLTKKSSTLILDMGDFDKAAFAKALSTVTKAGGPSPLGKAASAISTDLDGLEGKTALILVTDAAGMGTQPPASAMAVKETFGDSLCVYPILIGDDANGKKLMDGIAQIGGCGFATNADDLASGQQMADYVRNIFVGDMMDSDGDGVSDATDKCPGTPAGVKVDAVGCPLDSDKDGVPDYLDKCPGTPAGVKVDSIGCPLDSDGDGVPDSLDKCPGTPAGVKVDAAGCPLTVLQSGAVSWTFNEINFEISKADIKPASYGILDEIAAALGANPQLKVVVEGHTDSSGARAFNMDLSNRRAQAVVDYLVGKGVSPSRLSAKGYGPDRPIAENATKLGRSKNRRVQFTKVN
jgi:OOP family OmpA-OmpF porin